MTVDEAWAILRALQAAIDARDRDALIAMFDDKAVLMGTAGHAADRAGVVEYLTTVAEGEPFRFEFADVVPFHEDGVAAFGDVVVGDRRAPFRLTLVAVDGRIVNFHGSIPFGSALS